MKSAPTACRHRSAPLTAAERVARGVGHVREWRECGHPDRAGLVAESQRRGLSLLAAQHAAGKPVCGCQGCGVRCPGFAGA